MDTPLATPRSALGCSTAIAEGGTLNDKVVVPQIGWAPFSPKKATIVLHTQRAVTFTASLDGAQVIGGSANHGGTQWGLEGYIADLSSLTTPGIYSLSVSGLPDTCFEIYPDVYRQIRGNEPFSTPGQRATWQSLATTSKSFFGWQRCSAELCLPNNRHPSPAGQTPTDYVGLPIWTLIGAPANDVYNYLAQATAGTSDDMHGGWHDATSVDKETASNCRALGNLAYASQEATDANDRAALVGEMEWGVDYLRRIQNADGSFPIALKPYELYSAAHEPQRLLNNVDTGVTARCSAGLAAAAAALAAVDAMASAQALAASRSAWSYVSTNPSGFLPDNYYPSYWRGSADHVLGAAVELARATGESEFTTQADSMIQAGGFTGGIWRKQSGSFPGELSWDQDESSQAVVFLLRYYPIASPGMQAIIKSHAADWYNHWSAGRSAGFGIVQSLVVSWFGSSNALVLHAQGLIEMARVLGDQNALDFGLSEVDWVMGKNPFGSSFAWGLGRYSHIVPFLRPSENSIGAVLPGAMVDGNGGLTTAAMNDPSISWQVEEATIDGSSALAHVLATLNRLATR